MVNDTRVIPARLFGRKQTGGRVEVLLERLTGERTVRVQLRASKTPRAGTGELRFDGECGRPRRRTARASSSNWSSTGRSGPYLAEHGHMPLPPYIRREDVERRTGSVIRRYTPAEPGAVAAPTAGLHFRRRHARGHRGPRDPTGGRHPPRRCRHLPARSGAECAVSTGCTRSRSVLGQEVVAAVTADPCAERARRGGRDDGRQEPRNGGGRRRARALVRRVRGCSSTRATDSGWSTSCSPTFHLPESTLLMLVCAFAGQQAVLDAYRHAVTAGYRFFSYGDAMFLTRRDDGDGRMRFTVDATDGAARRGRLKFGRGLVDTPAFMPVGTYGTVKAVTPEELTETGAQIVLGNTFHLMQRPGTEIIEAHGGLHGFMHWARPILTDSGGFQVWSLAKRRKLTEEGVRFQSTVDGSPVFLSPEVSMAVQRSLGADVVMVFDECTPYPASESEARVSMELSLRWARRSREAHGDSPAALFGIVQGGMYRDAASMNPLAAPHRHRTSTAMPSAVCRSVRPKDDMRLGVLVRHTTPQLTSGQRRAT